MQTYYAFKTDHYEEIPKSDDCQWIHVETPTPEDIAELQEKYHLPKDYLTSVIDQQENSRHEGLHQKTLERPALILLQYPYANVSPSGFKEYNVIPVAIIITESCIITVANTALALFQTLETTPYTEPKIPSKEATILNFLWEISLTYNRTLKNIREHTEALESQLKVATENNQLYQLMDIQKSLIYFKAALEANLSVIISIYKTKLILTTEAEISRVHDISVETKQALTTTEIQLQLVTQISATFSAIVSNNLNIIMKVLTSATVVLTIPSVIGAIYGMNVKLPFAGREDAFWIISILTAIICWLCIRFLKKKKFF